MPFVLSCFLLAASTGQASAVAAPSQFADTNRNASAQVLPEQHTAQPDERETVQRWYGWQTLAVDAAVPVLILGAIGIDTVDQRLTPYVGVAAGSHCHDHSRCRLVTEHRLDDRRARHVLDDAFKSQGRADKGERTSVSR